MTAVPSGERPASAAFFDVDGTLVEATIAHYYRYFRRKRMSARMGRLWNAAFVAKCGLYLLLDRINRSLLNVVFYRSYKGLPAGAIKELVPDCFRDIIQTRTYEEARTCVASHQARGHRIVLVTGSLDFIVEPLARELRVDGVVAPSLVEVDGVFTGELNGPPVGEREKARRIAQFSADHGIDLATSHAYGDSLADLPMLEAVGFPHVVNPDKRLASVAAARSWPVHRWTLPSPQERHGR